MSSLSSNSLHSNVPLKRQQDPYWSILNEDEQDQEEEEEDEDDLESRSGTPPPPIMSLSTKTQGAQGDDQVIVYDNDGDTNEMISDEDDEMMIDPDDLDSASESQVPSSLNWRSSQPSQTHSQLRLPHVAPLGPSQPSAPNPSSDDEDDAKIMARLMAQHHDRQVAGNRAMQVQESEVSREARRVEDQESTDKARIFLEGLCLDFLNQLYVSEKVIASRSRAKLLRKSKGKRKEAEANSEDEEEGPVGVRIELKNRRTGGNHVVSFPDDPVTWTENQAGSSMVRIARILCIASLMYEACVSGITTTKRYVHLGLTHPLDLDIYYKDVRLFGTQAVVDQLVDDIVATAGLKRKHFNVCAASKGLIVSSCLEIWLKSGDKLVCSGLNPALIPPVEKIERIDSSAPPEWVLIVEKEAVFQPLCGMGLLDDERVGLGVIITGKGYPDLATLQLLALIANHYPATKFYGLFDADPHGLDILSVYTFGSQSSRFSHDHSELPLRDRLEWIGVKASELIKIGVKHDDLLPLTEKDVQKANAMLRDPMLNPACKRELVYMLHLDRKAEIQVILGAAPQYESERWNEGGPGMLVDYIVARMTRRD